MIKLNIVYQEYKEKPDYGRCVAIVASASLREMIKPGALAIISPIAVGEFPFSPLSLQYEIMHPIFYFLPSLLWYGACRTPISWI